jgi:hypothetical protein
MSEPARNEQAREGLLFFTRDRLRPMTFCKASNPEILWAQKRSPYNEQPCAIRTMLPRGFRLHLIDRPAITRVTDLLSCRLTSVAATKEKYNSAGSVTAWGRALIPPNSKLKSSRRTQACS